VRAVLSIAWRDLQALFLSLKAYVVITLLLMLFGVFFYLLIADQKEASMRDMFRTMNFFFLFVIPVITMGSLADERKSGTLELLLTCPVSRLQVVLGKFFAAAAFYTVFVVLTLQYVVLLKMCGSPDPGPVITGYVGLLLGGYLFIAVGIYASSLTRSSLVAALLSYALLLGAFITASATSYLSKEMLELVSVLGFVDRFISFERGLIQFSDVVYFLTATMFWISVTTLGFDLEKDSPLA
jgi:ABC-2 type transport system permease protein